MPINRQHVHPATMHHIRTTSIYQNNTYTCGCHPDSDRPDLIIHLCDQHLAYDRGAHASDNWTDPEEPHNGPGITLTPTMIATMLDAGTARITRTWAESAFHGKINPTPTVTIDDQGRVVIGTQ
jgi:hypothetical protein